MKVVYRLEHFVYGNYHYADAYISLDTIHSTEGGSRGRALYEVVRRLHEMKAMIDHDIKLLENEITPPLADCDHHE